MKKLLVCFLLAVFVVSFPLAAAAELVSEMLYGKLSVIADDNQAEIYVDGALAGQRAVTLENVAVGTHHVEVKLNGQTIFERMVMVQQGQQTTIVAQPEAGPGPQRRTSDLGLELSLTYGGFGSTVSSGNVSYSSPGVTNPVFGVGLGVRKFISEDMYLALGGHYNAEVQTLQLSSIYLDFGAERHLFWRIGLNYPIWNFRGLSSGIAVHSSPGYQVALGINLGEHVSLGVKYTVLNASLHQSGNTLNLTVNQTAGFVQLH